MTDAISLLLVAALVVLLATAVAGLALVVTLPRPAAVTAMGPSIDGAASGGGAGDRDEARRSALERNVRTAMPVGGGKKEVDRRLYERTVTRSELRSERYAFQAVGDRPAPERILQLAAAFVKELAFRHSRIALRAAGS